MRKITLAVAAVVVLGTWASAQIPTAGNVFVGYSYYNTNLSSIDRANTNGWEASVEGKMLPWVGIVVDFSNHYGSQNFPFPCAPGPCGRVNADVTERNILFGPRVSVSAGKFRPFAEALFGAGHVNVHHLNTDTSFATALGGGIDYKLLPVLGWRLQGDYIQTRFFGTTQDNVRFSTGIVVRF
jgi:Outer membrane protein beta-barrel domain